MVDRRSEASLRTEVTCLKPKDEASLHAYSMQEPNLMRTTARDLLTIQA